MYPGLLNTEMNLMRQCEQFEPAFHGPKIDQPQEFYSFVSDSIQSLTTDSAKPPILSFPF